MEPTPTMTTITFTKSSSSSDSPPPVLNRSSSSLSLTSSHSYSSSSAVFKLLSNKHLTRFFSNLNLSSRSTLRHFACFSASNPTKSVNPVAPLNSRTRNGAVHPNSIHSSLEPDLDDDDDDPPPTRRPIRIATFNALLFSMAPAAPPPNRISSGPLFDLHRHPKSIIKKNSPTHSSTASSSSTSTSPPSKSPPLHRRVSFNLPENEITLERNRRTTTTIGSLDSIMGDRTMADVLRELDLDILALQEVKAEEENGMKPLSDLATALGMKHYVFAESWAPQFGNAVLSKWPIKRWRVHKFVEDDSDFRNVLKTTIDIPKMGELNLYCTHLDHLNESWRMKQIQSIIDSNNNIPSDDASTGPHILVGGLNSLNPNDYSSERWAHIVQYYEKMGKPSPKSEVIKYLVKNLKYTDANDYAGEFYRVVVAAKGQCVQGTCKYGTRVDYVMASPGCPYRFVPGSYSVCSSMGTSDHHIVKVDVERVERIRDIVARKKKRKKRRQ